MSRRQRAPTKATVSPSVRVGLTSLVDGNEKVLSEMLSAAAGDDLVEKLLECMGVNNLSAEQLLANYCGSLLAAYCKRLGKSEKGGAATLAERVARECNKPSFAAPPAVEEAPKPKAKRAKSAAPTAEPEKQQLLPSSAPPPNAAPAAAEATTAAPASEESPAGATGRRFEVWRNPTKSVDAMGEPFSAWTVELQRPPGWWSTVWTDPGKGRQDGLTQSKPAGYTERHLVEEGDLSPEAWDGELDYHLVLSGRARDMPVVDDLKPFAG